MRRWAVRGPLIVPDKYDGANSIIQLVTTASQHTVAAGHTVWVQYIQTGTANEAATGGYILSTIDASSANGFIYRQRGDTLRMNVLVTSTGNPSAPTKTGTVVGNTGDAVTAAMTWDPGGNVASSFNMFIALNGGRLALDTPSTQADGSGTVDFTTANPIVIGNNTALTRTFAHGLARVIHWSGVRTIAEMEEVRYGAPPSLFGPTLLDWYNGEDHGRFRLGVVTRSLITPYTPSPYFFAPKTITRGKRLRVSAGAATYNDSVAEGTATATDAPAAVGTFAASLAEGSATAVDTPVAPLTPGVIAEGSATAVATQSCALLGYAYPISDIIANGWLPSTGGTLYPMLDEVTMDFSDYIYSPTNPTTQQFEVKVGPLPSNVAPGIDVALQAISADTNFDLDLVQGTTVLDSWTENVTVGAGQVTRRRLFSGAVAASITDTSDLRIRGVARA
jgi:hypothetical protein